MIIIEFIYHLFIPLLICVFLLALIRYLCRKGSKH